MPTSTCKNCDTDFKHVHAHSGQYCSKVCEGAYRSNEHKRKFFSGLLKRIERSTARKYLAEAKGYNCEVCGLSDWQGKKITLQVDHINGTPTSSGHISIRRHEWIATLPPTLCSFISSSRRRLSSRIFVIGRRTA